MVDTLIVSGNADITLTNNAARISGAINQRLAAGGFEAADLRGGEGSNVLDARNFAGPVKLNGFGGDDVLYGGQFDDTLNGSDGNDFVFGGDGNDLLNGGTGHDALNGDYGDDRLFGNDGSDILVGGFGTDLLYGGNGQDILIGGLTTYLYVNTVAAERVAVLTAWASSDPYATKVEKLGTQGIQSGTTLLKLTPLLTVFNDLSVDTLFGQADLDWFFASQTQSFNEVNIAQGGLRDRAVGEVLTPLL